MHCLWGLLVAAQVLLCACGGGNARNLTVKPGFHSSSEPTTLEETVKAAAAEHSALLLANADREGLVSFLPPLLASLSLSAATENLADKLLIIVDTEENLKLCHKLHSRCWIEDYQSVPFFPVPEDIQQPHWGQDRNTARLSWRRVDYVNYILALNIGVFITDLDLLFYGDPFALLRDPQYSTLDFFAQTEHGRIDVAQDTGMVNMGFCYFAPTPRAKTLVSMWMGLRKTWDQGALWTMLGEKYLPELSWKALPTEIAYSYCHPRLGASGGDRPEDEILQMDHPMFHLRYYEHLVQNLQHYEKLVTFHFPCCSFPTTATCKSFLMSLAMHARAKS